MLAPFLPLGLPAWYRLPFLWNENLPVPLLKILIHSPVFMGYISRLFPKALMTCSWWSFQLQHTCVPFLLSVLYSLTDISLLDQQPFRSPAFARFPLILQVHTSWKVSSDKDASWCQPGWASSSPVELQTPTIPSTHLTCVSLPLLCEVFYLPCPISATGALSIFDEEIRREA